MKKSSKFALANIFMAFAMVFLVLTIMTNLKYRQIQNQQATVLHQVEQVANLYLIDADWKIGVRHVEITARAPIIPLNPDFTPVHILHRQNEKCAWRMIGSGTLIEKLPGVILSAYHVFSDMNGQFGYRLFNQEELDGKGKIFPIIGQLDNLTGQCDWIYC